MEDFVFEPHPQNCLNFMVQQIKNAKKSIHLITLRIQFKTKINGEIIGDLLCKKAKEGVKITILLSEYWSHINKPDYNFERCPNIKVIYVHGKHSSYSLQSIFKLAGYNFKKCCKRALHLRLFIVDRKVAMIGNCDFLKSYYWPKKLLKKKTSNIILIEYGIIFKPNKELLSFVNNCCKDEPDFHIDSKIFTCNSMIKNTHEDKFNELIDNAQETILIENQIISICFLENIFDKLFDKFASFYKQGRDLKIIIVSNLQMKETVAFKQILDFNNNIYTFRFIYRKLIDNGIDDEYINRNLYYFDSFVYQNHNKLLVVDDKYALYGSSNLYLRSFNVGDDMELNIFMKGAKVKDIRRKLERYYHNSNKNLSYPDIYQNRPDLFKRKYIIRTHLGNKILLKSGVIFFAIIIAFISTKVNFLKNLKSYLPFKK